jgi:hypothetical protein
MTNKLNKEIYLFAEVGDNPVFQTRELDDKADGLEHIKKRMEELIYLIETADKKLSSMQKYIDGIEIIATQITRQIDEL